MELRTIKKNKGSLQGSAMHPENQLNNLHLCKYYKYYFVHVL